MWTYVDDCVCLDVVHVWVAETQLLAPPLGGADNTRGDGVLQGERATNGNHKLARAQVRRASEQQHWQLNLHRKGEQDKRESMGMSSLIRGGTVGWLSSGPGGGASCHLPSLVMGKMTHLCNDDTYFECESGERSLACIELVSCRDLSTLHASYWIASFLFLMKQ